MMNEYIHLAQKRLERIGDTQADRIAEAGRLLADVIAQDRLIYVFGAGGHTSLVTGEMFFRIGGLANIYPISEQGLTAFGQARKFIRLERCEGLGRALIQASGLGEGDILLEFHTIGVNATCIDAAKEAKRLGAEVIGVASSQWQDKTPADALIRASGGENLRDVSTVFIDDCNTVEDGELYLEGLDIPVGPLSGIGTFAIAHMLEIAAITECGRRQIAPPVWSNANTPEGAAGNEALLAKYAPRIPML